MRTYPVFQLADVGDETGAGVDYFGGGESRVDYPDVGGVLGTGGWGGAGVEMWQGAVVQGDVLLGDEARADARAQVRVEEVSHFGRRNITAALEEAFSEDGNRVLVRMHEVGEDLSEADLGIEVGNGSVFPWQQCRQRVQVVVVYLADIRVRYYDEGQVTQGLDSVGKPNGEQGEGKVG